jgi:tRNA-dihydrouridine synthase
VEHLAHVDGVMLGRAAYHTPGILAEVDQRIFGEDRAADVAGALLAYRDYVVAELAKGDAPGGHDAASCWACSTACRARGRGGGS